MITQILSLNTPTSSVMLAGRKGAGLQALQRLCAYYCSDLPVKPVVPEFHYVTVGANKDRGVVMTRALPRDCTFAVRSSGPVSMPGMMDTIINVERKDVQAAVEKVWDSYYSPHCEEYRKNNAITDLGTAVIVQKMVPDIELSGVVFTVSPNTPFSKGTFAPEIEYVEGTGEELVGGTKAPIVMDKEHPKYAQIVAMARKLYDNYNDSDIEFSISRTTGLNILQCRALVFAPAALHDLDAAADEFILKAKSIATNGTVSGILRTPTCAGAGEPDTIIYLQQFTPETYKYLYSAKGVVTSIGGKHCHAAIVGRDIGKVVISDVPYATILTYLGKRIMLRAPEGIICTVKEGASTDHHGASASSAMADVDDSYRLPSVTTMKKWCSHSPGQLYGQHLVAHFYNKYNDYLECKVTEEAMMDEIKRLTLLMSTYLYASCCGEIRHAASVVCKSSEDDDIIEYLTGKQKLTKLYNLSGSSCLGLTRLDYIDKKLFQPTDLEQAIDIMSHVDRVFRNGQWSSSYGGKKWANISSLWLQFARKEISALLFLDAAFNLAHNGGSVFGKVGWLQRGDSLSSTLDYRRTGLIAEMVSVAYLSLDHDKLMKTLAEPVISDKLYNELLLNGAEPVVEEPTEASLLTPIEDTNKEEENPCKEVIAADLATKEVW